MKLEEETGKKSSKKDLVVLDFEADQGVGTEGMSTNDTALPFLKVLSKSSDEIDSIDGAKPGMFYNSVTDELFDGQKGLHIIPCHYVRQYLEWAPRGSGTGSPVNIYPANSDILTKTHKEPGDYRDYLDNGNYIDATANFYVLVLRDGGHIMPALIVMKSTQLKKARKWNSTMKQIQLTGKDGRKYNPAIFSHVYHVTAAPESNDKGKWYGWNIVLHGPVKSAKLYKEAKVFREAVIDGTLKTADENNQVAVSNGKDVVEDIPF